MFAEVIASPVTKPSAGTVPIVVAAAGAAIAAKTAAKPASTSKPATTVVTTGITTARSTATKPPVPELATPAVAVPSTQFQEEGSTTLTTALAGVLAVLTWGTAAVLIASYLAWI